MTLKDFQPDKDIRIVKSRLDKKASPIVSRHIEYWEKDDGKKSINTEYYKAIMPYFADIIFRGILEEETRYYEPISASESLWGADEVFYIGDFEIIK